MLPKTAMVITLQYINASNKCSTPQNLHNIMSKLHLHQQERLKGKIWCLFVSN